MPAQPNRFDKHAHKVLALVWVVALIAGVALLEWMLTPGGGRHRSSAHSAGPSPARHIVMREWRRDTDYTFPTSEARRQFGDGSVPASYALSVDSAGFIEPARRHEKPDITLAFLGGSTTECALVLPHNRFPDLAARKLEAALGLKVNGLNAGMSGNNSMHALALLVGKVLPQRPDFVVLMEAVNDVGVLSAHGSYWVRQGSLRFVVSERQSVSEAGRLLTASLIPYTTELVQNGWRRTRELFGMRPAYADVLPLRAPPAAPSSDRRKTAARAYESSLKSFVHTVSAWGATPVLMTQVNVEPRTETERRSTFLDRKQLAKVVDRPEDFASMHDHFNAILRAVAKSEGTILIDLAAAHPWAFSDVYDAIHFTDRGSQRVAEIIAAALQDPVAERAKTAAKARP
jgi:lysophospholipase L1-like esterase